MGMIAEYLMIDQKILDALMDLNNEDLNNKIFEVENSEKFESIDIDKIRDALHCFLTGVSASEPIEWNKLSEAIVGIHMFVDDEDADFIACIENTELQDLIIALEGIDFEKLVRNFNPAILKKKKIYPEGIWEDNKEQLIGEFKKALDDILKFYKRALATKHHVIVSIL